MFKDESLQVQDSTIPITRIYPSEVCDVIKIYTTMRIFPIVLNCWLFSMKPQPRAVNQWVGPFNS